MLGNFGRAGVATVALVFLVLAGCGTTEEKQKVNLGYGVVVEVPANLEGKDLLVGATRVAYADQLDLIPQVEDCNLEWLQQIPKAGFDPLLDLPKNEQVQAGLNFVNRHAVHCIQSGDNVVEPGADSSTMRVVRGSLLDQLTYSGGTRGRCDPV